LVFAIGEERKLNGRKKEAPKKEKKVPNKLTFKSNIAIWGA
jgi:hypothetical protein